MRELLFEHTVPQPVIICGLAVALLAALFCFWRYLSREHGPVSLGLLRLAFMLVPLSPRGTPPRE
jgi:hypothetical protein